MQAQDRDPLVARTFAALPDALTCAMFVCAWISPLTLGYQRVRDLMLLMLIEFIVMHSGAFTAAIFGMDDLSRLKRALFLTGLTAFYMVFILAFSLAFDSAWPIWGFLWLFVSRFLQLVTSPAETGTKMQRMLGGWVMSAMIYLLGAVATAFLPLPSLGLTPEVIAGLHLSGGGLWIDQPWTVMAFGAFYFGVLGYTKLRGVTPVIGEPAGREVKR